MTTAAPTSDRAAADPDVTDRSPTDASAEPALRADHVPALRVGRAESLLGLIISSWLLVRHWRDVNWATFIILFSYIDIIGYLPGLARVHQKRNPVIETPFYWAYNATHTFLTAVPVAAIMVWLDRRHRWSALAVFIHLFGDRGLLGNFTKVVGNEFEHIENHV